MLQKVGCRGFPVARSRYFGALSTVEISSSFLQPPALRTAEAWRREAPAGFEFSVAAWQLITHPEGLIRFDKLSEKIPERRRAFCGHFKPTPEVGRAWERTQELAAALAARFIVFETPRSFYPDANHLRDMYGFFKTVPRKGPSLVWHPRASWEAGMAARVCRDLGLILASPESKAPVKYLRVEGAPDERLRGVPAYVYFGGPTAWAQARRYLALGGRA